MEVCQKLEGEGGFASRGKLNFGHRKIFDGVGKITQPSIYCTQVFPLCEREVKLNATAVFIVLENPDKLN